MTRCHLLLRVYIRIPKALLVDHFALNGVHDGQSNSIGWKHEILPNPIMQVPVVRRLELCIPWSLNWIIEHGRSIASLHWFVLVEWPCQDAYIAVHSGLR